MFVKKLTLTLALFLIFLFGTSAQNIKFIDNKGTLQSFNPWRLNGNTGITEPLVPTVYGTSTIGSTQNFLGTTDSKSLVFGTNNIERLRINTLGQVGIGTATPMATFDVTGMPSSTTTIDGLIAPRLTGDQLFAKGSIYTPAQKGAIVYVTAAAALVNQTSITQNVNAPGYYYFDGLVWKSLQASTIYTANGTLTSNRTLTQGANTLAFDISPTSGTSHFSVDGTTWNVDALNNRIGIGTATPTQALDVVGNLKFSGALLPNNTAGTSGQVLASAGSAAAPTWVSSTDLAVTHSLSSSANSLTSTVNGLSASANIINSNVLTTTNGQLVSTVNGVATATGINVLTSANNGLTATNGLVQLGGSLSVPTTIATSASNTLAITNLQAGVATDNIVVADASSNALKTLSANAIIKGNVFRYTITAGDVTAGFATIDIPTGLRNGSTDYFQLLTLESANSQTYTVSNKTATNFRLNLGAITAGDIINVMIIK